MDEIYKFEQPVGTDRLIVLFINQDVSEQIDPVALLAEIGRDASERDVTGWSVLSVGSLPMRQAGTVGNVMFQSGGQYATQVAVVVVYARDRSSEPGAV